MSATAKATLSEDQLAQELARIESIYEQLELDSVLALSLQSSFDLDINSNASRNTSLTNQNNSVTNSTPSATNRNTCRLSDNKYNQDTPSARVVKDQTNKNSNKIESKNNGDSLSSPAGKSGKTNDSKDDSKEKTNLPTSTTGKIEKTMVVNYWPSWSDNWTRDNLRATPDSVNVINIAFALPDGKGSLTWNDDIHPECTKKTILELKKRNKCVLLSVGGATAHEWNLDKINLDNFARKIKKMVDSYHLDGVDIDCELNPQEMKLLPKLFEGLRKIMPTGKYILTYAAWSIGAYGIKGHEHREWDGNPNKGKDIPVLQAVGHLIDWVNVMSYDAFDPNMKPAFNPIESIESFRALLGNRPDKVLLGIEIGTHSWPKDVRTNTRTVMPWMQFAHSNQYRGVFFWLLQKDIERETLEPNGSFLKLTESIFKKK